MNSNNAYEKTEEKKQKVQEKEKGITFDTSDTNGVFILH